MPDEPRSDWNTFARANAAQRWRQQSSAMGREVTRAIVEAARAAPGMRVLDLACGSGEPAMSLAREVGESGSVIGIDISAEPLKIARERAEQRGLGNVEFRQADVHQLPFGDAEFDRVTSRFGVMFFADLARALGEVRRVLKPGGRVLLQAWGPMQQPYFETTIGTIVRLLPGTSVPPSARAMFKFGEPGALAAALRGAGFSNVEEEFRTVAWSWPGPPEDVWAYFQDVTVPFRPLLEAIPAGRRAEIDQAVLAAISRYYDGQQVNFTATINLTTGRA